MSVITQIYPVYVVQELAKARLPALIGNVCVCVWRGGIRHFLKPACVTVVNLLQTSVTRKQG